MDLVDFVMPTMTTDIVSVCVVCDRFFAGKFEREVP